MNKTIMKCKLCLTDAKLIKKSHIIPDFMYADLYNQHHQFIYTTNEWLNTNRVSKKSSGLYESNILCYKCENELLSSLETYAKIVLYGGQAAIKYNQECKNFHTEEGIIYTTCKNIDYAKFKIFLLSILWRASISKIDFFSEVNLGPHEEILRNMILNCTPGEVDQYPILMFGLNRQSENFNKLITQPRKLLEDTRTLYAFIINGVMLIYNVSMHKIPQLITRHSIRPSNELELIHLPAAQIDSWFKKLYGLENITAKL